MQNNWIDKIENITTAEGQILKMLRLKKYCKLFDKRFGPLRLFDVIEFECHLFFVILVKFDIVFLLR